MILTTKSKYQEVLPMGNSITQKLKYKQSVIKFSYKSLSLKVNSRFCSKLEFSLGTKFYLSRI